jgi:hypothetical protein
MLVRLCNDTLIIVLSIFIFDSKHTYALATLCKGTGRAAVKPHEFLTRHETEIESFYASSCRFIPGQKIPNTGCIRWKESLRRSEGGVEEKYLCLWWIKLWEFNQSTVICLGHELQANVTVSMLITLREQNSVPKLITQNTNTTHTWLLQG